MAPVVRCERCNRRPPAENEAHLCQVCWDELTGFVAENQRRLDDAVALHESGDEYDVEFGESYRAWEYVQ